MSSTSEVLLWRQRVLAEFGDLALQSEDLDEVLHEACRLVAEALGTGRAKVLEIEPGGESLFVRAGVGWAPDLMGQMHVPMGKNSLGFFSIEVGKPIITQDISKEERFEIPQFHKDAGIVALANVPIFLPGKKAYGLLEVNDTKPRDFDESDTEFLRTYASILGPVIDRLLNARELRSTEERFRFTVETATDYAVFTMDPVGRITDWLPGAAAVFGWGKEEAVGQPVAILFTLEDREAGADQGELETARRTGSAPDVRWHLRKDGSHVFIEGVVRPLTGPDGRLQGFIKIGRDVTERRATEEALRASEERSRGFADASSDAMWILDAQTRRLEYLNPAYEEIWGEKRETVLANLDHWSATVLPEDLAQARGALETALAGQRTTVEYRIRRPDGGLRYIRDTGFPIHGEDGRVRRIGGVAHDLTKRRRAELARESSERRLRTLMEGIPQLVWRSRGRGEWTWTSPQWRAFTGQTQEQSLGQGWLDAVHPDDRGRTQQVWEEARAQDKLDVEHRIQRGSDGSYLWHHTRALPVRDEAGRVTEWLGTSTDVQVLKELQKRQEVLVLELQHRTRNLITVVRSISRQTMASATSMKAFRDTFDNRLEALSRVQGLLSRAEQEPITLGALIRLELEALGATEGEQVVLDGPPVQLRPSLVQTLALALHELATNARKYGALSEGGGRLAVRWLLWKGDGGRWVHIEWREEDLAPAGEAAQPSSGEQGGYGRRLIERALPYALEAKTTFDLGPTQLRCTIDLPLDRLDSPGDL